MPELPTHPRFSGRCRHSGFFLFPFESLSAAQLTGMLDANPHRMWEFQTGNWRPEQTLILATRAFPLKLVSSLMTGSVAFHDNGDAFLCPSGMRIFHSSHWCGCLKHAFFSPFPLKSRVDYFMELQLLARHQTDSFHLVPKQLAVNFILFWTVGQVVSFLNRLDEPFGTVGCAGALIRVLYRHPHLTQLNISGMQRIWEWQPHIQLICRALEDHPGIRFPVLESAPLEDDADDNDEENRSTVREESRHPAYSWLKQLLTRNRTIVVADPALINCIL